MKCNILLVYWKQRELIVYYRKPNRIKAAALKFLKHCEQNEQLKKFLESKGFSSEA